MSPLSPELLTQYEQLSRGGGIVDVSDRTKLELRGVDRVKFLNSFCTNDVKRLQPGESCEAFVCNVKGHVLAHINVLCRDDALWIDTVAGQGEKLSAHLDRYLIREDVQIADRTTDFDAVLAFDNQAEGSFRLRFGEIAGSLLWLAKGESLTSDLAYGSRETLEILRIEQGYPWFGVDISEENLPQEVDRNQHAISFTKGCYLGQETVARIDALGHVNKTLSGLAFSGEDVPIAGSELRADDKSVGHVTSACWSPKANAPLALGYVRRGYQTPGTKLASPVGEATVVALPV